MMCWKACVDYFLVKLNLHSRIPNISPSYLIYDKAPKSVFHCLMKCRWVSQVFQKARILVGNAPNQDMPFISWCQNFFIRHFHDKIAKKIFISSIATFLWQIWKQKIKSFIFQNDHLNVDNVVFIFRTMMRELKSPLSISAYSTNKFSFPEKVRWLPLEEDQC